MLKILERGYEVEVKILEDVMKANDQIAEDNREMFTEKKMFVINLMSSPGSGKTTLLEKTFETAENIKFGVIEGDVRTSLDGDRIARYNIPVVQIHTELFGGACHLDANMVKKAWKVFPQDTNIDLLFIENIGNLVCPAGRSLGEDKNVVVLSVTEGEDKPAKYPLIFRLAHVLIINKIDLLPFLDINVNEIIKNAKAINPKIEIMELSAKTGEGLEKWITWLEKKATTYK